MKNLDKKDLRILDILQRNSRLNTKEIADKVGLSVTPTYERIKRIEKSGFIHRFVALLNRKKVGKDLIVFCSISLQQHAKPHLQTFEQSIHEFDEVMECYHIAGSFDYLLKVVTDNMEGYQYFLTQKLTKLETIATVRSSFVMSEVKCETAFKLE